MEQWIAALELYPQVTNVRAVTKVIDTAAVFIKQSLAPFEIEWFLQTLFNKPVQILKLMAEYNNNDAWCVVLGKCFELLSTLVQQQHQYMDAYFDAIVKTCMKPYNSNLRRRALPVVELITQYDKSDGLIEVLSVAIDSLNGTDGVYVRQSFATLVGKICEHRPELLTEDKVTEAWRKYLCVLEASKISDNLKNGVLQGLNGLFRNFGQELPTAELNNFYKCLADEYLHIKGCQDACFKILTDHSNLFPEKISEDKKMRLHLWKLLKEGSKAEDTLRTVYSVAANRDNVESIVNTEIYPRTHSAQPVERNVAHRILTALTHGFQNQLKNVAKLFEIQTLNASFSLQSKLDAMPLGDTNMKYDHGLMNLMEEASLYIERNTLGCDQMLKCMIERYKAIPKARLNKLLIHVILRAPSVLRTSAITFLISDSCLTNEYGVTNIQRYLPLWKSLFDTSNGKDQVIAEHCKVVFEDVIGYLTTVVECFLYEDCDLLKTKDKLSTLLQLTSEIITLENARDYIKDYMSAIFDLLVMCHNEFGLTVGLVGFIADLVEIADENCMFENGDLNNVLIVNLKEFYKSLQIHTCKEEALLCASCLSLIQAPTLLYEDYDNMLCALEIIFSRNDVEPKLLIKSLKKFENLLQEDSLKSNEICFNIILQIEKLKLRNDLTGMDARIQQRDVVLFLGTYSDWTTEQYKQRNNTQMSMASILKEGLCLSIPILNDRRHIKFNLYKTLDLALKNEDPVALDTMLLVLSAELSTKQDPNIQKALIAVIVALSYCHSRGDSVTLDKLQAAVKLCSRSDCVKDFVHHIAVSKSPGVRKILSNLLEIVITLETHSEQTEMALTTLFDELEDMLNSDIANHRIAALDLVETALEGLNENTDFTKEYLPSLIKNIIKTNDNNTVQAFKITCEFFIEKIALFTEKIEEFPKAIFDVISNNNHENIYLTTLIKYCLMVFKSCFDVLKQDCLDFDGLKFEISTELAKNVKSIIFLTEAKDVLNLNKEHSILLIFGGNVVALSILEKIVSFDFGNDLKLEEFCKEITFKFLEKYAEVLSEVKYQDTVQLLSKALFKTKSTTINKIKKKIRNCINEYRKHWKNTPQMILTAFEKWCQEIPLEQITFKIQNSDFIYEDSIQISALNNIITIIHPKTVLKNSDLIKQWTKTLKRLHARNYIEEYLKSKMACLKNILAVSFYFFSRNEGKELLSDSQNGVDFCKYFISVFAKYFLDNDILVDTNFEISYEIMNEIIMFYGRNKCDAEICGKLLDLLEKLWPKFEISCETNQLHTLLLNLNKLHGLNVNITTLFAKWCLNKMADTESIEEKVQLMQVLGVFLRDFDYKGCLEYDNAMASYSRILPTKWSPRVDRTPTLTLYKTLSVCADTNMMRMALSTVADDEIPSEIEISLEECMKTLASTQNVDFLLSVYRQCEDFELCVHLYDRVLVPLLSHAPQQVLEQFFATTLQDVLKTLSKKSSSDSQTIFMEKCARGFQLAKCAYDLLPLSILESSSFQHLELKFSRSLSPELSKMCFTLRTTVQCEENSGDEFKKIFRYYQTSNYNCLAAILLRKSSANFNQYKLLLKQDVWPLIVDYEKKYIIYIEPLGRSRLKRHLASRVESTDYISAFTAGSYQSVFTRTKLLSDNPFLYDFNNRSCESLNLQNEEMILTDNELNSHPCASVLSSIIKHLYVNPIANFSRETTELIDAVLKEDLHSNVKWLLSQIIVNCKDDLKTHGAELSVPLVQVVAQTPYDCGDVKLLNGLHVNILNTIAQWHENFPFSQDTDQTKDNVNSIITFLINTALHHKQRPSVFKAVLNTINSFCCLFKDIIKIDWNIFDKSLKDSSNELSCLEILLKITSNKIDMPELLTVLIEKFHSKYIYANRLSSMGKLLGQALSNTDPSRKPAALLSFCRLLEATRRNDMQSYVKILFYCTVEDCSACNEVNFRHITDLTSKMLREQKSKCFYILATYVKQRRETNEYIAAMFETIDFSEAIYGDFACNAMEVVKCGFTLMDDTLKRRVVFLVADLCAHAVVTVRRMAYDIMVLAFKEKICNPSTEPTTTKRIKKEYPTVILNMLNEEDFYLHAIGSKLGVGLMDDSTEISEMVLQSIGEILCENDLTVRFCEAVLIALFLPTTINNSSIEKTNRIMNATKCLAAILNLLFMSVTSQDGFQNVLLRDESLHIIGGAESRLSSKLLTLSHTYQGTFRRTKVATSGGRRKTINTDTSEALNVQTPLKNILDTILKFSNTNQETSSTLFIETIKVLKNYQSSFNMSECLASILVEALTRQSISHTVSDVSPCMLMACRCVLDQCCGLNKFRPTLEWFLRETKRSEGEILCRILYEEMLLRVKTSEYFVMGNTSVTEDVDMSEFSQQFSLQEISTIFGKLSNWDDITIRHKRQVSSNLPTLWTDHEGFHTALIHYEDGPIWLKKMQTALCEAENSAYFQANCLREVDRWPRRQFNVSAITESIKWCQLLQENDLARLPTTIRKEDCFAEWAVRLMARAQYITKLSTEDSCETIVKDALCKRIRGQELVWCGRVNDSHLAETVLQCVRRNISTELRDSETLGWLLQQAQALRNIGVKNRDDATLNKALGKIEKYSKDFIEYSPVDVATSVGKLQLVLYRDLKILSDQKIDTVLQEIDERNYSTVTDETYTALSNIIASYEICLCYYDGLWKDIESKEKSKMLNKMADIMLKITNVSSTYNIDSYACMLINRIIVDCIDIEITREFCEKFGKIFEKISKKQREILEPLVPTLKHAFTPAYLQGLKLEDTSCKRSKQSLQLICDPAYTLFRYIERLGEALVKDVLSDQKIDTVLQEIDERNYSTVTDETYTALSNIIASYEICLCYYDGLWKDIESKEKSKMLNKMADIMLKITNVSSTYNIDSYACMLINRIIVDCIDIEITREFCEKFGKIFEKISKKQREILEPLVPTLKHAFTPAYLQGLKLEDTSCKRSKQSLQLICDPAYTLFRYIERLGEALVKDDESKWMSTFNSIFELFSNPMAGTAFQSLNNHFDSLKQIRDYESTQEFKEKSKTILKDAFKNLEKQEAKNTMNLQSLCPYLTSVSVDKCEKESSSLSLLLLGDTSIRVLKFSKEIKVYTNSIRRPCVLKAVLSNGHTRRFLIKRGEPLRVDAALSHVLDGANKYLDHKVRLYNVTPLSEDCGIIDYLDNHVTLRSLLSNLYSLDDMARTMRAKESEAITASRSSTLLQFEKLCDKVPAYALRNAIEEDSISFQEFVMKKANFLNTLAAMTVLTWIFGLGDRHTENLLYSTLDGAVCSIDYANVFTFGVSGGVPELPPARLTRNMIGVCDFNVLESRIQNLVTSLREAAPLLIPTIRVNFMWQSHFSTSDYQMKLQHTEDLLKGTKLPHQVISEALLNTRLANKEDYVQLLNEVFSDSEQEEMYDIETQVSCLLRQCTDPRILSVTRSGWEPWI